MKRFQECSWIVKIWRYRWYILIPFRTIGVYLIYWENFRFMWKIFKGDAQLSMNWTWNHKEINEMIKNLKE